MMATFFIFIVVSNYIGLLPGAGQVFTVPPQQVHKKPSIAQ